MVRGNKFKPDSGYSAKQASLPAAAESAAGFHGPGAAAPNKQQFGRSEPNPHSSQRSGPKNSRPPHDSALSTSLQRTAAKGSEAPPPDGRRHGKKLWGGRSAAHANGAAQHPAATRERGAASGDSKLQHGSGKRGRVHAFAATAPPSVASGAAASAAGASDERQPLGNGPEPKLKPARKRRRTDAGDEQTPADDSTAAARAVAPHLIRMTDGQPQRMRKKRRKGNAVGAPAATVTVNGVAVQTTLTAPAKGKPDVIESGCDCDQLVPMVCTGRRSTCCEASVFGIPCVQTSCCVS